MDASVQECVGGWCVSVLVHALLVCTCVRPYRYMCGWVGRCMCECIFMGAA